MPSIRNIYFEKPIINRMTQGSIINGCIADAFPNEEVFGLIVTPRCDLSHDKVDSVHYLPVVPFERWFEVVAKPIIKKTWKKKIYSDLNNLFKREKIGANVMDTELSYDDMLKICNEKVKKESSKKEVIDLLNSYFDKGEDSFNNYLLEGKGNNKKNELIKYLLRLEGNNIPPFYLLEAWHDYGQEQHLVVLLREVHRIQFPIAMHIKSGIYESMMTETDMKHNDLFFKNDPTNFFWVQAEISSPFIEHIMQAFIYNFSRIGVDDRPGQTIDYLFNSVKTTIK